MLCWLSILDFKLRIDAKIRVREYRIASCNGGFEILQTVFANMHESPVVRAPGSSIFPRIDRTSATQHELAVRKDGHEKPTRNGRLFVSDHSSAPFHVVEDAGTASRRQRYNCESS